MIITLTRIACKVLEHMVTRHMMKFIEDRTGHQTAESVK